MQSRLQVPKLSWVRSLPWMLEDPHGAAKICMSTLSAARAKLKIAHLCCLLPAEETAKPSTPLDALSPLQQPMAASEDSALSDTTSDNCSTAMLGKGPEAARVPNGTGMASSKFTNGNGMPKHAKHHKMQGGKAHVQRQVSPPR